MTKPGHKRRRRFGEWEDTPPDVRRVQLEFVRTLGVAGRFSVTLEEMLRLRELAFAGIRLRHPGVSEEQAALLYLEALLPRELYQDYLRWCASRQVAALAPGR